MAGQGGEALAGAVAAGTSAVISGGALVAAITQMSLSSSHRSVSIHLSNFSDHILTNPQVYTFSGYSCTPAPHPGKGSQGDMHVWKWRRSYWCCGGPDLRHQ
ncbi:hypothetical protein COCON_G00071030 [Conger conger]|uniref:Uncharacterized protein n=1 Tax=Conger conger TaxID=82655 RepID=A0A9Q1I2Q9_CONCO|nr:hypothetical protein COCON_G00071030 [Conger conger]